MDVLRATALIAELPTERTRLLDNLGRIRREIGPIAPELSDALADHMNIRRGEVHEVVSFYSFLQVPADAVRVCTGPVCDCFGARELLERTPGAIEVACLGHCDLAPAMTRGDVIVPPVTHSTNDGPAVDSAPPTRRSPTTRSAEASISSATFRRSSGSSGAQGLRAHGLRRRRLPDGLKWEAVSQRAGPALRRRQRGRGRARDDQGPLRDGAAAAPDDRGDVIAMRSLDARRATSTCARSTRPLAPDCRAIDEFRAAGLLDGLSLELVIGAGAYIAGEETAMLESMEGRRAMPRLKPPFPSQVGYLGRPTLIQNVETLAHIPAILRNGGEWWAGLGTRGASGTRLWSVTGAVGSPGCYEAPSGITTRELVEEHAGGFTDEVGSIVPGGAASGILPPVALDAPLTRDGLREYGAGPGSAAVQVFPTSYSPLRLLAETMRFFAEESCQKCTPCRIGNRALHHLFEELEHGEAAMTREKVDEWLLAMEKTSICGLGQASPFPVRNAMTWWPELFAPLEQGVA